LPGDSIYALLSEHGDRIVRVGDFADCFSEGHGRPSILPSLLAKVLLLAYRDGLSDERAMDAVRFDLRWKVALDLPVDHPGFHPTFQRSPIVAALCRVLERPGRASRCVLVRSR
jgi:transposase